MNDHLSTHEEGNKPLTEADAQLSSALEQPAEADMPLSPALEKSAEADAAASSALEQIIEEKRQRHQARRESRQGLFLRNILNGAFILLAVLAMIGIAFFERGTEGMTLSYYVGIVAVLIKIVEVMLRMPGFKSGKSFEKKQRGSTHK